MLKIPLVDHILEGLRHLYSPDICPGCENNEPLKSSLFCLPCLSNLPIIEHQKDAHSALKGKMYLKDDIQNVYSLYYFTKDGIIQQLIHKIKYYSDYHLAIKLGRLLGEKIPEHVLKEFYLIPVPIHYKRLSMRGYNQSALIAQGMALSVNNHVTIVNDLLVRTDQSISQTKRSKGGRGEFLKEAFTINKKLKDKRPILLIDDVITTGATINACIEVLAIGGYTEVDIATLAISI